MKYLEFKMQPLGVNLETWVLIATVLVILWYTIETCRLRKATKEQTEQLIRPLIVLGYTKNIYYAEGKKRYDKDLCLINCTDNPAMNIYINVMFNDIYYIYPKYIPILHRNESKELSIIVDIEDSPGGQPSILAEYLPAEVEAKCKVSYNDIKMNIIEVEGNLNYKWFEINSIKKFS